ncbi:MAG: HD domain-containing phosphohydrolase [Gammaproteobacteria bacterium]
MRDPIVIDNDKPGKSAAVPITILALLLFFVCGMSLIYYFVRYEKDRDNIIWQDRLLHLTAMEKKAVDNWLGDSLNGVAAIAENTTLKLYLSRLAEGGPGLEQYSYSRYIRELLILKSSELGFNTDMGENININHGRVLQNGLLLVDPSGKFIAAGNSGFKLPAIISDGIKTGRFAKEARIEELFDRDDKRLNLAFVAPVYPPQINRDEPDSKPIAYVVGIKEAGNKLVDILKSTYILNGYENITLLKEIDGKVVYLVDLNDNPPLLNRTFALEVSEFGKSVNKPSQLQLLNQSLVYDMTELDAVAAIKQPRQFLQKINAGGREVLLQSDTLQYLPWVLMHTIDKEHALLESNAHARLLYTSYSIIFILLLCSIVLIWRHGASVRYQRALTQMADINDDLTTKNKLLKLITDNISHYMMIIDKNNRLVYGNKALANISGEPDNALIGKNLASVLGASTAKRLEHVLTGKSDKAQLITLDDEQGKILHASQVPLPGEGNEQLSIVVATDISDTLRTQKQKENIIQQAVLMLSAALERHDPYSAQHSERVKTIANAIGHELGLTENEIFNLNLSASLANIGKFYVPAELLGKPGKLTDEEYKTVKGHIDHTITMLEEIDMDRDIIISVSQSYERLDGSGYPKQLCADEICLTARIIGVANAFAAMICPRSWRQAIAPRQVLDILMADAGYDRKIVVALANFVENKGDFDDLLNFIKRK